MDFDSWQVDIAQATAKHSSGFRVEIEGNPADPSGISPSGFPEGLSAAEQARLLRCGMQAIMKAARNQARKPKPAVAKPVFKSKGDRPVLSLKQRASSELT
jgi:hypothetical protein